MNFKSTIKQNSSPQDQNGIASSKISNFKILWI